MKFKQVDRRAIMGTSLQGYIETSYSHLVAMLGEPHDGPSGDGKCDVEWYFRFEDGTICTVYNYKTGKAYMGARGQDVSEITEWHIGGRNQKALQYMQEVLAGATLKLVVSNR